MRTENQTATNTAKLILLAALANDLLVTPNLRDISRQLDSCLIGIARELPTDISVGTAILNLRPEADNAPTIRERIQDAINKLGTIDYVDACDTPDFDAAYAALHYVLESLEPKPGFSELYGL